MFTSDLSYYNSYVGDVLAGGIPNIWRGIVTHVMLDDEQARIVLQSSETVELRDRHGRHLGYVAHGFSEEDFAAARRRRESTEPRYSTQEVLDHLRSLETK